jgi:hypothetical protein
MRRHHYPVMALLRSLAGLAFRIAVREIREARKGLLHSAYIKRLVVSGKQLANLRPRVFHP